MKLSNHLLLTFSFLIITLSACSSTENSISNELDGIELILTINKQEISSGDEVVAKVTLTNHNDSQREIFVPIPKNIDEGISAVMVEKKGEMLSELLSPKNSQDILNIKERSFYDFVLVELSANETIEQEFHWNKKLLNQESREIVDAEGGEYLLSSFIILDELNNQKEYYEPEKQLISKLNFTVK